MANAQTRAVRDGDEWVINGSKMFTTNAQIGDYVYLLTRTNSGGAPSTRASRRSSSRWTSAGIEVQAVYTLSGERTNITYYTDVRVPDSARIGDVDGGWRVLTSSLHGRAGLVVRAVDRPPARGRRGLGGRRAGRIDDPDVRGASLGWRPRQRSPCCSDAAVHVDGRGGHRLVTSRAPWRSSSAPRRSTRAAEDLFDLMGPDAAAVATSIRRHPRRPSRVPLAVLARHDHLRRHQRDPAHASSPQRGLGLPR